MTRSEFLKPKHWWPTPFVGAAGGWIAATLNWPLPWMIGSLLAVILFRCLTPWRIAEIPNGRKIGQLIVGIGIGLHFNSEVTEQIAEHFLLILAAASITVLGSVVAVWLLQATGEDRATSFFASMPGGSGEMVNLGARNGAQLSNVAAAQSLRVVAIVLCIPALFNHLFAGATIAPHLTAAVDWQWLALLVPASIFMGWAWQRLKQPNPWLFGPLLVSALASIFADLHIGLPTGSSGIGQLLIGAGLGCYFDRAFFKRAPWFLCRTMLGTAAMVLIAGGFAWVLSFFSALDLPSLTLSMMPGGIAEMSLTAEALNMSVPLVTAVQVLRLLIVLFCAEPLFRLWQRKRPAPTN
ncbi:AbrB family transcriptional regulator [Pseudomonas matsuisoli]|uniref:Membrane protein n=1 Tax=Pseudomonas matsuisoli TaxID=1515666 RepID=A0A917PL17_9PSED|nr:AbrB family transcriptional regulator [Pseudomonas matsuisoli]GGJ82357.1 membrane protein [Pseudomonas matsuisoli]